MNGTPIAGVSIAQGPAWITVFRSTPTPASVGNSAITDGQPFTLARIECVSGTVEYRQRGTHDSAANNAAGTETELPQLAAGESRMLYGRRGTGGLVEARGVGAAATIRFDVLAK